MHLGLVLVGVMGISSTARSQSSSRDTLPSRPARDSTRAQALNAMLVRPVMMRRIDSALVTSHTVTAQDLARMPQPMGDLFRAMARLPGVSSTDQSARLALRGAGPDETLVLFDGMRLRDPFHLKDFDGSFSVLDESVIDAANVQVGHAPVDFGDQLGGVVTITPRSPAVGHRTTATAGLTGLRLTTQGARRGGAAAFPVQRSWLASLRRSWLTVVLDAAGATDDPYTSVRPVFDDAMLRVTETRVHRDGAVTRLAGNVLVARDGMHFRAGGDPALDSEYRTGYAWVTGTHVRGRGTSMVTAGLTSVRAERSAVGAGSLKTSTLADDRTLSAWSVRATHEWQWTDRTQLRAGTDLTFEHARAATWRRVGLGTTPATIADGGRRAVWMGVRHRVSDALSTDVGVRREWWPHLADVRAMPELRDLSVDPRASLLWQIRPGTSIQGSYGGMALGMGVGDRALADADSAWYGAVQARAWSLSLDQSLPFGMHYTAAAYRRFEDGGRPRFVNVTGSLTPVGELEPDRQRLDVVGGRAMGIDMSLRGAIGRQLVWSGSYTSARATDVRPNGAWVPRPWDVRHAASGDLSWTPGKGWVLAAGANWHTGWPYSRAAIQVLAPTRATAVWPTWMNGRSANYWRIDARIARTWTVRRTEWRVYADAFNLLNRFNGRGEWTRLTRAGTVWSIARYPVQLAPRIPTAGVTVSF